MKKTSRAYDSLIECSTANEETIKPAHTRRDFLAENKQSLVHNYDPPQPQTRRAMDTTKSRLRSSSQITNRKVTTPVLLQSTATVNQFANTRKTTKNSIIVN